MGAPVRQLSDSKINPGHDFFVIFPFCGQVINFYESE